MSNDELLRYIAEHMVTKADIAGMATKDDIKDMATKDDLRETENMILTEVDRIQERSEEHYAELCTRIRNLENKVVVRSEQSTINLLVEAVSTLKTDVEYLKAKIS